MLEEIDNVDWSSLHHAYGTAEDVPGLIRALISPSKSERDGALYELFGNIWHQGTVYEATAFAVPFLIDLLNSPSTPDRSAVAMLIASIAGGHGYLEVHARPGWGEPLWRKIFAKEGATLKSKIEREVAVTASVRHEAKKALPALIPFLSDTESEVRLTVAEALGAFPEFRDTHLPLLQDALKREIDEYVRESIEEFIIQLSAH